MQDLTDIQSSPPSGYDYAGFSSRALAFSIDQTILILIVMMFTVPAIFLLLLAQFVAWPFTLILIPTVPPVGMIVAWIYFAGQESSKHQATFGKRMCGLTVTDMDGNRISFFRATMRFWGKFISSAIMLMGFIMAAFTEHHQALHDMIAETLVLKKQK